MTLEIPRILEEADTLALTKDANNLVQEIVAGSHTEIPDSFVILDCNLDKVGASEIAGPWMSLVLPLTSVH